MDRHERFRGTQIEQIYLRHNIIQSLHIVFKILPLMGKFFSKRIDEIFLSACNPVCFFVLCKVKAVNDIRIYILDMNLVGYSNLSFASKY